MSHKGMKYRYLTSFYHEQTFLVNLRLTTLGFQSKFDIFQNLKKKLCNTVMSNRAGI
jgi:hypothetical protein